MKIRILLLLLSLTSICFGQEICDNGIDDDGDGKIDLNDPECRCNSTPVPSIIPNASFEQHTSCPNSISQLDVCTGWMQATTPTTDYMNTCGAVFEGVTALGNRLMPFPDGEGICGAIFVPDWSEYLGSCLTTPMVANTNYQLTFYIASMAVDGAIGSCNGGNIYYEPVNVTIYGTRDCINLPLSTVNSPSAASSEWVELGHIVYVPESRWQQVTISFMPTTNINAIMLGGPPTLPPSYSSSTTCLPYFLFDALTLNESAMFGVNIGQTGTFCGEDLVLVANPTVPVAAAATYQWYRDGIAIPGANLSTFPVASTPANITRYSVRIVDGDNCFVGPDFTINALSPAPEATSVQPTCFAPTGTITVTTPSDFYSFDNGVTWVTNPVSAPLIPGRYFVKTKTDSGCISAATSINLTDINIVNYLDYTTTLPGCNTNGSITITSVGSEYSFDGGLTWSTSNTASLPFGNYNIRMKDALGCVVGENYAYLEEYFLDYPSITSIQPTCGTPGSITVSTPAESYSFDDGITWVTTPTATNLSPGVYPVKIKNAAGCTSFSYYEYLYEQYLDAPNVEVIQITCSNPGSVKILNTGMEYSFDGGNTWGTDPLKIITEPGYFEVVIKNSIGCRSFPYWFYISQDLIPPPDVEVIQPSCGATGSVTVRTIASEYSFDGGFTWTTNPVLNNLNDYQFYEVKIKDIAGCISYGNYAAIYPSSDTPYAPYVEIIQPGSCTTSFGTITVTSFANMYSFDNGVTWTNNNSVTNLSPGEYKIKVKEFSDCESPATIVNILAPLAAPLPPVPVIVDPTCTIATGTITINEAAAFYSYDNGITWVAANSAQLNPGTYKIRIKNAAGCISEASTAVIRSDISAPATPGFSLEQPNCAITTGTITITSTAEAYSFNGGLNWDTLNKSGALLPGYYDVRVRNAAGCESSPLIITIQPDVVSLPVVSNVYYCKDTTPVALSAAGTNLSWYTSATGGTASIIAPVPTTTSIGTTTWYVSQNINGCEGDRAEISVTVIDNLPPPSVISYFEYCQNEPIMPLQATGTNLLWYTSEFGGMGTSSTPVPSSASAGTFTWYVSQSTNTCESNRSKIIILVHPTPAVPQTDTTITYKHHDPTEKLTAQGNNLRWYNSEMEELAFAPTPSSAKMGQITYYITQTIGFCDSPPLKVVVNIIPNYMVIKYPKYFTPNGDNTNESWNIYTPEFGIIGTVYIYDRYGKLLTQIAAPGKGWDGTFEGRNLPATDYWFSVFYSEYGVGKELKSHFSLVR